jgi:hypothetical protein
MQALEDSIRGYRVRYDSIPAGATIECNGQPKGVAPFDKYYDLTAEQKKSQVLPLSDVFSDKMSLIMIGNAFGIFESDVQTEKLAELFPIAKQEDDTGSGEFLIRDTKKAQKGIEAMFPDEDFDPREVPRWTASDLA